MICQREGCNCVLPEGRRKFCCDECAKLHHRRKKSGLALRMLGRLNVSETAARSCLDCDDEFPSDGPWNRLCDKCKRREAHQ